ncbi:MAG: NAD(P)/FAD-dependent oxidoreductase [Planctomycetota bacterium]|jgi:predicted NAD/FAD-binding protein
MRIAIVGGGVSGLTCAHRLHETHEVTVFEANDYPGGHTNTIRVDIGDETHEVDTGFIVYNRRNYPNFVEMLDGLGVRSQPTSMSFSVRCDRTGLEYNPTSPNKLLAQRTNLFRPRFWRLVRDILRFLREAPSLASREDETVTVRDFLAAHGFGEEFGERFLVPLGASLWSSPPEGFREFPVRFVVDFLENHGMLTLTDRPEWLVIQGGSKRYVEAMTRPLLDRIRLSTPVRAVRREPDGAHLVTDRHGEERYDHVIFACHSDQALRMLADPTSAEREILGAFPYQRNEAVLHTDPSVLPRKRRAWGSWNYHVPADERDRVAVTYHMNRLQSLDSKHELCVTLNDDAGIDPEKVIRRITYHHPVYTTGRAAARTRRGELIDANRTSFCGAYWGYGFHEDGVRSALEVCDELAKAAVS